MRIQYKGGLTTPLLQGRRIVVL